MLTYEPTTYRNDTSMPVDKQEIANRLRTRREEIRLTQDEVAQRLGIARTTYTRYETGVNGISAEDIPRIAKALYVNVEYFLAEEDAALEFNDEMYKVILSEVEVASSKGVLTPELVEETARYLRFRTEEEAKKRGGS